MNCLLDYSKTLDYIKASIMRGHIDVALEEIDALNKEIINDYLSEDLAEWKF